MKSKNPLAAWYARADARAAELHAAGEPKPRYCLEHPSWVSGSGCQPCQDAFLAKEKVRREYRARMRRARDQVRRDLGLTKTPYGWE